MFFLYDLLHLIIVIKLFPLVCLALICFKNPHLLFLFFIVCFSVKFSRLSLFIGKYVIIIIVISFGNSRGSLTILNIQLKLRYFLLNPNVFLFTVRKRNTIRRLCLVILSNNRTFSHITWRLADIIALVSLILIPSDNRVLYMNTNLLLGPCHNLIDFLSFFEFVF